VRRRLLSTLTQSRRERIFGMKTMSSADWIRERRRGPSGFTLASPRVPPMSRRVSQRETSTGGGVEMLYHEG